MPTLIANLCNVEITQKISLARPNGAPELAFVDDLHNEWGDVIMCGNEKKSTARPFGAQVLKTELELGIVMNNNQILNLERFKKFWTAVPYTFVYMCVYVLS